MFKLRIVALILVSEMMSMNKLPSTLGSHQEKCNYMLLTWNGNTVYQVYQVSQTSQLNYIQTPLFQIRSGYSIHSVCHSQSCDKVAAVVNSGAHGPSHYVFDLMLYDMKSGNLTKLLEGWDIYACIWDPQSEGIFFIGSSPTSFPGQQYLFHLGMANSTPTPLMAYGVRFSRSLVSLALAGNRLYIASIEGGVVESVNLDGSSREKIMDARCVFSVDSQRIGLVSRLSDRTSKSKVLIMGVLDQKISTIFNGVIFGIPYYDPSQNKLFVSTFSMEPKVIKSPPLLYSIDMVTGEARWLMRSIVDNGFGLRP